MKVEWQLFLIVVALCVADFLQSKELVRMANGGVRDWSFFDTLMVILIIINTIELIMWLFGKR